jgi:nucleoside-diphosphate-sugar epimerase
VPGDERRTRRGALKALVTGGAGFIGAHLARALARRGERVDLVDNFARGRLDGDLAALEASPAVRLRRLDLLDAGALRALDRDYDHVIHLAAVVGVAHVVDSPLRTLRANAAMTDHVLAWARGLPALERFLFASTSEVYAGTVGALGGPLPTPETVPLTVADVADPRAAYAISKLYGEALCQHAGVPFTIVRPHNVYGPRMGLAHVVPELLERAHRTPAGGVLEVYSPDHRRTFCFVADAVATLIGALDAPACAGETLNVGRAGPEVSIRRLAELVSETVGKPLRVRGLPATPGSPRRRCPDMGKTERLTGTRARTALEDGLRLTYEWYRAHGFDSPEGVR